MKRVLVVETGMGLVGIDMDIVDSIDLPESGSMAPESQTVLLLEELLGGRVEEISFLRKLRIRTSAGSHVLLVSAISGYRDADRVFPLPSLLKNSDAGCFAGTLMLEDAILPVLNLETVDTLLGRTPNAFRVMPTPVVEKPPVPVEETVAEEVEALPLSEDVVEISIPDSPEPEIEELQIELNIPQFEPVTPLEKMLTRSLQKILTPDYMADRLGEAIRKRLQTDPNIDRLFREWKENVR